MLTEQEKTEQEKNEINEIVNSPCLFSPLHEYQDFTDVDWKQAENRANRKGQTVVNIQEVDSDTVSETVKNKAEIFAATIEEIKRIDNFKNWVDEWALFNKRS